MRRLAIAALLGFALLTSAQQQDFSKVEIKVTKVSGNIYMLEGAGGNIAASVGEDGIVIVDDQYAHSGARAAFDHQRCEGVLGDAEGHHRGGAVGNEARQEPRSNENRQNPCAVGREVGGEVHQL